MANLTTVADIKADVLARCGEITTGTSPFDARVLDLINRVHMELVVGGSTFVPELAEMWPWARSATPGVLAILPALDTSTGAGTITVTNGSTAGTFGTAPSASLGSLAGRFLWVYGYSDVYRIATHTSNSTSFTLDLAWQSASVVAGSFRCAKLDYTLTAGVARLVEPFRIFRAQGLDSDGEGKVEGLSTDQLHRRFPLYLFGMMPFMAPTHFATISEADNVIKVRFNSCPSEVARVEYEYIPVPADLLTTDTSLIPREHRSVLALGAAYWLMVDKEDSRADLYQTLTQRKIQGMLLERRREFDDQSKDFAKIHPRQDQYWRPTPRGVSGLWYP